MRRVSIIEISSDFIEWENLTLFIWGQNRDNLKGTDTKKAQIYSFHFPTSTKLFPSHSGEHHLC